MPSDSDPDPSPELLRLTCKLKEHCAKAIAPLPPALQALAEVVQCLRAAAARDPEGKGRPMRESIITRMTTAFEAFEQARAGLQKMQRICTKTRKMLEAKMPEESPRQTGDPVDSDGPEILSLEVKEIIDGPRKKGSWYTLLLDGKEARLPGVMAITLLELGHAEGPSTDSWVSFKTRTRLAAAMSLHQAGTKITEQAVSRRVCQLKTYLTDSLGYPDGLIESRNGDGHRLRLVRPPEEVPADPSSTPANA